MPAHLVLQQRTTLKLLALGRTNEVLRSAKQDRLRPYLAGRNTLHPIEQPNRSIQPLVVATTHLAAATARESPIRWRLLSEPLAKQVGKRPSWPLVVASD